jgi:hypothetical protein
MKNNGPMKVSPRNQFCPVNGCETDKPHTDDPVVAAQMKYSPAAIAREALVGMAQLRDSMQDDLKGDRSFAILTRIRQVEELFHRMIFCLFIATPEEMPHFLSEARPNSFDSIYKAVKKSLGGGRLTLDTHIIQGDGLPAERFWAIMHHTAHVSMRAMQMAHDAPNGFNRALVDTVVQRRVLTLTNIVYAFDRGDSRDQIREHLVATLKLQPASATPPTTP